MQTHFNNRHVMRFHQVGVGGIQILQDQKPARPRGIRESSLWLGCFNQFFASPLLLVAASLANRKGHRYERSKEATRGSWPYY